MKFRIIASTLLVVLLSAGLSMKADANPWRGGYRGGWCRPHVAVRVCAPVVPVYAPRVVVGGYYGAGPGYYGPRYYAAAPHYYAHGYYGGGYRHYGPRGYYHR